MATDERFVRYSAAMRKASGDMDSNDPLVSFLSVLARDHLPVGVIDTIVFEHVDKARGMKMQHDNGWIAQWAQYVAAQLRGA